MLTKSVVRNNFRFLYSGLAYFMRKEVKEMALTKDEKAKIIKEYARSKNDTGSAEVQIAILTQEITELTEH